jgi:alpha-L-fucosidase 2
LNLWVEKDGDLLFYIARTDAWSECCTLLKLGRVRIALSPNPFLAGALFRQKRNLRKGCVEIATDSVELRVFVDAHGPVVYVTGRSPKPAHVKASVER